MSTNNHISPYHVEQTISILTEDGQNNPFFDVKKSIVHITSPGPGEKLVDFFTIEHRFFACAAVCLDETGNILLVHVPRFPVRTDECGGVLWELPGGRNSGAEAPIDCMARELREETGLAAGTLEPILGGYFYPESSLATEKLYLYAARDLHRIGNPVPEREGIDKKQWFSIQKAKAMIHSGEIRSSWTIIGVLNAYIEVIGLH
jgi:ADP-ribose pyrophosphatase